MDGDENLPGDVSPKPVPRSKPRVDKEARKADYLRAAARAFLARGSAASMQDVADAAGAPKPVFYRIFPSRAELIDALFQHVQETLLKSQQSKWEGYGWALRVFYLEAKKDPEIFLAALKTFRGDPTLAHHRDRLQGLVRAQATNFFQPSEGAPPGPPDRTVKASRTMTNLMFDTLVTWLEDTDGLTDERRFVWYGRVIREWRLAMREAYELDPPDRPAEPHKAI